MGVTLDQPLLSLCDTGGMHPPKERLRVKRSLTCKVSSRCPHTGYYYYDYYFKCLHQKHTH